MAKKKKGSIPVQMRDKEPKFQVTPAHELYGKMRSDAWKMKKGQVFLSEKDRPRKRYSPRDSWE